MQLLDCLRHQPQSYRSDDVASSDWSMILSVGGSHFLLLVHTIYAMTTFECEVTVRYTWILKQCTGTVGREVCLLLIPRKMLTAARLLKVVKSLYKEARSKKREGKK